MLRIPDNSSMDIQDTELKHLTNIQKIAQLNINLSNDTSNLLIFSNQKEKINNERIFDLNNTTIQTNNIMGFVGLNDTEVTIHSRFAEGKEDYFLHYMLQKVFSINIFDLKHSSNNENNFDFLLFYLFPYYLKKALGQGIYKEYQRKAYNNANIKGPVNISRHIRHNLPFAGKIAYSAREHSYDNKITQLIRHTIEYIAKHQFAQNILSSDAETKNGVAKIIQATPSFEKNRRTSIINKNVRPMIHPYFSEYRNLQKICLQILRYEGLKYGQEKDKIYGLLFDGAWLWEEYTNTILKDCGFKHPRNDISKDGIRIFKDTKHYIRYPDFWKEGFFIDAKYRILEKKSIDRDSMHQIISYMYIKKAHIGGFLYPVKTNDFFILKEQIGILNGYNGLVKKWGIPIPSRSSDFKTFCSAMHKREMEMKRVVAKNDKLLSNDPNLTTYN